MSHSRIVPAFFLVALVHVMVIAGFVTTVSAPPPPRPVGSKAMMAQLLPEPTSAHSSATVQSPAPQPRAPTAVHAAMRSSPEAPRSAPPRRIPLQPAPMARPLSAGGQAAMAPASQALSSPSKQPPKQATENSGLATAADAAAATAARPDASPAAGAAARETVAQAPAEPLDHTACRIAKPTYPESSKRRGETGTVTVRFVVGTRGAIDNISLVKSSGFERLDEAAIDALRESTCEPGSPAPASYVQAFKFGLEDE